MKFFSEIYGQNNAIDLLRRSFDRRMVSHAYLFCGPSGVGKKTCAVAFARALLCRQPLKGDACGECRSCRQVEGGNHPDFIKVEPDGGSIKIEQAREIQRRMTLAPFQGGRQICLIDRAESMTDEAANCFLKILEEPPAGVVFLLICVQPYALPATVLSRCQQVLFQLLPISQVALILAGSPGVKQEEADLTALLSGGSVGQAIDLLSGGALAERRKQLAQTINAIDSAGPGEACRLAGSLSGSREETLAWIQGLMLWYRDLLVWKESENEKLIINRDFLQAIKEQASYREVSLLIDRLRKIEEARNRLSRNANPRLVLDVLFLNLCRPAELA
ncbi:MAG: DNA polymerase III, gamma/tau subunit [Desulfotomaculum sp. 46_296]|nr:MAG: DNA polymerase III, gamma/tau subunit [Desulfotomaculum sp. 46_296]